LAEANGAVILMGVGLDKMTLLHLAEQMAGRHLFLRWANGPDHQPMMVETGGCSDGFENFGPVLTSVRREKRVGESSWQVFPAQEALAIAVDAIRREPEITHCDNPKCNRCNDAVLGGPI
jgi:aminoglycoside 3-N-acetyltransferase